MGVGTTTPSLKFYVNGTAGGTSTWTTSSDLRLKTDVVDLKDALSKVRRLRGVSFRWADRVVAERAPAPERGRQVGFIAQEVREVVPEVVLEDQAGMLSIAYASLVPVLVEAIKQQQETIDEMTHRVRQLEMKALETVSLKEEVDALRRSVGALVAPGPRTQEANADSESSERHRLPACASFGKVAGAQPANRM